MLKADAKGKRSVDRNFRMCIRRVGKNWNPRNRDFSAPINIIRLLATVLGGKEKPASADKAGLERGNRKRSQNVPTKHVVDNPAKGTKTLARTPGLVGLF